MIYIVFDNPLKARQISGKAFNQKSGGYTFKWSYLVSNDKLQSCLLLDKIQDYTDFDGSTKRAKCSYNDFKDFYKKDDYTEHNNMPENFKESIL